MITRSLLAAVRRHTDSSLPSLRRGIRSWGAQPPMGFASAAGRIMPQPSGDNAGRGALWLLAGGAFVAGVGVHHALQTPKHLRPSLQSRDTDSPVGALIEGGLIRMGHADAATRLLASRAPHTRSLGAKMLLEHAPTEATVRTLQRCSETEADPVVEHKKHGLPRYLAPGGIEGALIDNLRGVIDRNPGLEGRLLAATDRDALRLRPLLLKRQVSEEVKQELIGMLKSADAVVRRRAIYALHRSEAGMPSQAPAWVALAADPDRMVRRQVCLELYALTLRDHQPKPAWFKAACEQLVGDADELVTRFAGAALKGPQTL